MRVRLRHSLEHVPVTLSRFCDLKVGLVLFGCHPETTRRLDLRKRGNEDVDARDKHHNG